MSSKTKLLMNRLSLSILVLAGFLVPPACKSHTTNSINQVSAASPGSGNPTATSIAARSTPSCLPDFPYKGGWLGGDAIYSVDLGGNPARTLWLFGDTFVNLSNPNERTGGVMIDTTIGISTCIGGKFDIEYHWRQKQDGSGEPEAFFDGYGESTWPGDGIVLDGKLYIFGMHVRKDPEIPSGFEIQNSRLLIVTNYQESPEKWEIKAHDLQTGPDILAGVSVLVDKNYLLLYSSLNKAKGQPMALMRCPINQIETCKPELLTEKGWAPHDGDVTKAKILLPGASTEFSVDKFESGYLVVYNSVKDFPFATDMNAAYSKAPEEAFGNPILIKKLPTQQEMNATEGYCYATKEHPHLRIGKMATITFVCNSFKFFEETVKDLNIYKVQVLAKVIKLP